VNRRKRGFPHAQSLDGVEAVSWRRSVFTKHRTDLPFPPAGNDPIAALYRALYRLRHR
jgi:hypothetical protein